ncbi:MAG: CRISPR-associated protein Cas2 [Clostridiales bacterium]|jgi:CRISPR-associated protein Cas2|nr:CRISPR-associated protein Cas2 [Clostridiales bacterium]
MMVLITYDVNLEDSSGQKRLRHVAKACENVGQRVQKSVFECLLDPEQLVIFKNRLLDIIDSEKDSLRFYYLGKNWGHRVEHFGVKPKYEQEGTIIL